MSDLFFDLSWPVAHAAEALEALARAAGCWPAHAAAPCRPPTAATLAEPGERNAWFEQLGAYLGVELLGVEATYPEVAQLVEQSVPALVCVELGGELRVIAVLSARRSQLQVIDPSGQRRRCPLQALVRQLEEPHAAGLRPQALQLLSGLGLSAQQQQRALRGLLRERLKQARTRDVWLLRGAPAPKLAAALRSTRLLRPLGFALLAYAAQFALLGLGWHAVTQGALLGEVDRGWLLAWGIALISSVPLQALVSLLSARFFLGSGALLRSQLLSAIVRLDPSVVRRLGSGQLLLTVMEAGALESLGLSGSLSGLFAVIDLGVAAWLLSHAAHSGVLLAALAGCIVLLTLCMLRYLKLRRHWTDQRMQLTRGLIEAMVGHRTRLAQEPQASRHEHEDRMLEAYLSSSSTVDRAAVFISSLPRVSLLICLAWLALSIIQTKTTLVALAMAFGGALLAARALGSLASSLNQLSAALIAYSYIAPVLAAPRSHERAADPTLAARARARRGSRGVLEARGLTVLNPGSATPVLSGLDLRIQAGDQLLLEGASGSGKSTLAYALAGLRPLARGTLSWNGLDRPTLGSAWRQRVNIAPQFHDNHVWSGTFAFNLLLGRRWPPEADDLEQAELVSRELGLGPLLERMPRGLSQILGEAGWQLSHGERSRLFAARAILADADLTVLDESIAALDPDTAALVLSSIRKRVRSLLLIAHP
ncbi:MAG TPA: ABC transporter ATP-binding protein [Polyangiales bacterium]|nr:ABC transporter ATP-binding protein [Polyangiales bacterium]